MEKKKGKRKPSQCKISLVGEPCSGKYVLKYEDNIPIFTCSACGDRDLTWKKFFQEYLTLYSIKENWDVPANHVTCILGFFCHMYKEFYGIDYTFVPKNPNPYGCREIKQIWTLLASFENNAHEVRRYIYWLFKKRLSKSANIVSFGYLIVEGAIRQYKLYASKKTKLTRSSLLSSEFIAWCRENTPEIFKRFELTTINDLGALLKHVECWKPDENSDEVKVIRLAEQKNLIKDHQLNIGA